MSKKETLSRSAFEAYFTKFDELIAAKEGDEAVDAFPRGLVFLAFSGGIPVEEAAVQAEETWEELHTAHVAAGGEALYGEDGNDALLALLAGLEDDGLGDNEEDSDADDDDK